MACDTHACSVPPSYRPRPIDGDQCDFRFDWQFNFSFKVLLVSVSAFLRATAVPAGTAEARISYGDSVCPSVRLSGVSRPGGVPSPGEIETPGLHHMIA